MSVIKPVALHIRGCILSQVGFPGGSDGKGSACSVGDLGLILGQDPLEKGMAAYFSIVA